MKDACFKIIKHCFLASRLRYNQLIKSLEASSAFDYIKHKTDFFNAQRVGLQRLLESVVQWEKNGALIKEVKENRLNEIYFVLFERILSEQFDFISKFNDALDLYFNHKVEADQIFQTLQFFTNDSFDTIGYSSSDPQEKRQNLESSLNRRLQRQEFVRAIQIYHLSVFETFERVYQTEVSDYQPKLLASDYRSNGGEIDSHISLRYGLRNAEIILKIFDFLSQIKYINCSYDEFATIFYPGINQIQWLGTQKQLMIMFKGSISKSLAINNTYVESALVCRFRNKKHFKPLNVKQLRVEHNGFLSGENVKGAGEILTFLERLSN